VREISKAIENVLILVRWKNLIIIGITQYATSYFLIPSSKFSSVITDIQLLILSLSTILIAAAGYIINDYYDVKIDYVNKPNRVVVGRFFKRRSIIIMHATFNTLGILGGLWISWEVGLINTLAAGLLWLYSNLLKRLPLLGNLTVAALTGMAVFIVYIYFRQSLFLVVAYASFAFFISLIREIIKDMEDIEGDKKFDCKTLPLVIGLRKTKVVIYIVSGLFLLGVALLLQREQKIWWVFSGLFLMLSLLNYQLFRADKNKDYCRLSSLSKKIMILGLISMIFFK
jgi:4-hydroxybenzoate polyprenyltransferase